MEHTLTINPENVKIDQEIKDTLKKSLKLKNFDPDAGKAANEIKAFAPCSMSWKHLKFSVMDKKTKQVKHILKDVSGMLSPGDVLAIMGPSGSGKTTMLDVLADRVGSGLVRGDIHINGRPRDRFMRKRVKYVAQEDALFGCFTVYETLLFTAHLVLGNSSTKEEKNTIIRDVVRQVGLDSCLHTRVGDIFIRGISGGQKRRLSIAVELLARPAILLLDEPTSGLDSASALSVMVHLRELVGRGHAVGTTIHQPSSMVWETFTHFMLLVEGRLLFFGKRDRAIEYFSNLGLDCPQYCNPSDYFLQVINTDFEDHADVDDLVAQFLSSEDCQTLVEDIEFEKEFVGDGGATEEENTFAEVSYFYQFHILIKRSILGNFRNPGMYSVRAFTYLMLALVAGSLYWNDQGGSNLSQTNTSVLLFFVHAFMAFLSLSVLPFFIEQRAIFLRERGNGTVKVFPYALSNFISCLPFLFAIAMVCGSLVVNIAGLNNSVTFSIILFVVLTAAESAAHLISALVSHYIIGIALGAGAFGAMLLCSGMTVTKSTMPFFWIWLYHIGINTYAFEAFMLNQFDNSSLIVMAYEMEEGNIWTDVSVLCIHIFFFQICFFLVLYFFHTGRR